MRDFFVIICLFLFIPPVTEAQEPSGMSAQDSLQTGSADGELVLDEIEIQGQIEKPGVIVLPKRVDPEMGQMELDRSFDNELKNGVEALPQPEDALGRIDGVQSIKKAVERKRN